METATTAGRVLMGDSLGFHILFVLLSLTVPILVSWFELRGIVKRDKRDTATAHFWSKIAAILVVTGVISGTVIALQMTLVWPGILKFGGKVIGLPFMFETYAFLIEAVFLSLYLTTWKKVKPMVHWAFGLFVVLGSSFSAFAITSVNAWMNYPTGFSIVDGKVTDVNVWAAMFSTTSLVEFAHSMPAYLLTGTLVFVAGYSLRLIRAKKMKLSPDTIIYTKKLIHRLMIFAAVLFVLTGIGGDLSGKYLAKFEPSKLAALELNYTTRSDVPLLIGGVGQADGTVVGPHFEIPYGLSLLVGNIPSQVVVGLNDIPTKDIPPLTIHTFFNIKMTLLDGLVAVFVLYFGLYYFKRQWLYKKITLSLVALLPLMAAGMIELGWMITEIGRQPWAVRGYVTTVEAFTTSEGVRVFGFLFPTAFAILLVVTIIALRKLIRFEKARKDSAL
ncbi:MAG TPA: cytochrome ubiquinol oxidase subunit I [Candidatus Microsaccharimonas sp.]|jgi:cytochrome d ubiquinol oxidase subunit I